ncbi:hypothetical protein Slin15195_G076130 [Septoria linicola]|uniref:Uncharacterized protein n=1 Tax=Septoria linicola TaxID=215465 RepID=A0A9Q9ATA8_9PEZI|nr:hypothetical protein Slin14017_G037240 [Septoria linicola]USW54294.1 hypothetical protein Slin15195_G076130 [Septoria linicola]
MQRLNPMYKHSVKSRAPGRTEIREEQASRRQEVVPQRSYPQGQPPSSGAHRNEILAGMRQRYTQTSRRVHGIQSNRGASAVELLDDSLEAVDSFMASRAVRETVNPDHESTRGEAAPSYGTRVHTERERPPSMPIPPRPYDFDEFHDLTPRYQRWFRRSADRARPDPDPRPHAYGTTENEVGVGRSADDPTVAAWSFSPSRIIGRPRTVGNSRTGGIPNRTGASGIGHTSRTGPRRHRPSPLSFDNWTWVPPSWSAKLLAFNLRRGRLAGMDSARMPLPGGFFDDHETPPRYFRQIDMREPFYGDWRRSVKGMIKQWALRALESRFAKALFWLVGWVIEIALWVFTVSSIGMVSYVAVMAVHSITMSALYLPRGW